MPPQQAYRLLDFIDQLFRFCAHGRQSIPLKWLSEHHGARPNATLHRQVCRDTSRSDLDRRGP
jgi:hypothetical protein